MASLPSIGASSSSRNLGNALQELNDLNSKLSSGKRINKASADAAGLAIAAGLNVDAAIASISQRGASLSESALQIAEGGASTLTDIETRQAELAAQASNGTLNDGQRSALDAEYQALQQEKERVVNSTQFNGQSLLTGINLSSGSGSPDVSVSSFQSSLGGGSIATVDGAKAALDSGRERISELASNRAEIGAGSSRLQSYASNQAVQEENLIAARSRIEDLDYAEATANRVAADIRSQAGVAVNASANQSAKSVLSLLA